ncbi:MAG: efflux RND transporter periplasmic adaptor subunit, partial [Chloroflexota bacterium]|nr:efflux RND transporter periplasmic adaptor subunit [Chloroflexota bacterium]
DLLVAGADPVVAQQMSIKAKDDQLAVAQASLKTAQDNLDKLLKPDSLNVDSLRQQVALAKTQLADAEQRLADVKAGADLLNVDSLAEQLDLTKAQLADTVQRLADVKAGADPLNVASLAKQLELTKAQLADVEQRLADVKAGADPATVALKDANLKTSKLTLQAAQERLAKASLSAPFDGVVTQVSAVNGQAVGANTAILTLADTTVVEVSGNVDEIDILYVKEGATATVTLDALQGRTLQGTVSSISSAATTQQSVVRYPVRIRVTVPSGVELRAGLTATANVVLQQENNVLLIPSLAVRGSYTEPYVLLADGGVTRQQSVTVGNSDGYWIVVSQGLKAGDRVVLDGATTTAQSNINAAIRQFQSQSQFGGGMLPGGGMIPQSGGAGGGQQPPQGSGTTGGQQQRPQTGR